MVLGYIICFGNLVDGYPFLSILTKIDKNTKRVVGESGMTHIKFHYKKGPPRNLFFSIIPKIFANNVALKRKFYRIYAEKKPELDSGLI